MQSNPFKLLFYLVAVTLAGKILCAQGYEASRVTSPAALMLTGDVGGVHDPSMIHSGTTWYVFTTGKAADGGQLGIRCSQDLKAWRNCGHVFDRVPQWIQQRSPETKDLWAPDISFEHGEYRVYYAFSAFGKNTSGIALATNKTLDSANSAYAWKDVGLIVESRVDDDFNAIDANYVEDKVGHAWLTFGSFWSGIKLRAIDKTTGKLATTDTTLYSLARRSGSGTESKVSGLPPNSQAVEAPFIVFHDKYYYLFTSFDLCCRGIKSTYRIMVGRARHITGPYVDREGVALLAGGGSQVLTANERWLGPGGESVVLGTAGAPDLLVYHAYENITGTPYLQISILLWRNGWPVTALADAAAGH